MPGVAAEPVSATGDRSRRPTRRDRVIALVTALFVVGVAFLGADKPPPPGFAVVLGVAAVLGWMITRALPRWRATNGCERCFSPRGPAGQGALVGLALYVLTGLLPLSGEPSITVGLADRVIGGAVAASVGAAAAGVLARLA